MTTRAGRASRLLSAGLLAIACVLVLPAARAVAQVAAIDTKSDFATVSWGPGRIDLFARGVDGTLEHKFYNGRWSQWQSLGGVVVGAPAAASWGVGRLDVFARGSDNAVHHIAFSGGAWSAWESIGGATNAAPAATSWGANRIDVFVRGTDNALYHKWWNGTAWTASWENDGGTLSTAPAVTAWAANRLDVFIGGSDHGLWHKWWAGAWSGWENDGGTLTSAPTVASWAANRLDVFYRGSGNVLDHKWWAGSGWSGVQNLGGTMSTSPAAVSDDINHIDVYYRNGTVLSDEAFRTSWQASTIDETPGNVPTASYTPTVGLQGAPAPGAVVGPLWFAYVDNVGRVVVGEQTDPGNVQSLAWTVMSGNEAFSGPPALSSQPNGLTLVAGQHADSDVWTLPESKLGPPPAWSPWLSQGGSLTSAPVAGRLPDGTIVLYATDATGQVWALPQSAPNGAFGTWKAMGGSGLVAGSLSTATVSDGVRVFGVNASGSVLTAEYFATGSASAWTSLGGSGLAGTPAVVVYPGYLLRVFVRGADGVLVTKKADGTGVWESAWSPVGSQAVVGSPAAVLSPASGKTEVVARAADGTLWNTGETAQASGVWRDWTNVTLVQDVAATDPTIVTFTGDSGATWGFVFRNADQQNRFYTLLTGSSVTAAARPNFDTATLPAAPAD